MYNAEIARDAVKFDKPCLWHGSWPDGLRSYALLSFGSVAPACIRRAEGSAP